MQVETFEQTEVVGGELEKESSPEALELIKKLGLSGQEKLVCTVQDGGETVITRCPYREMSKREKAVYETIYPHKTDIKNYGESMIPLRVMQVAAHAESLGFYQGINVWSELGKPVDPILVGMRGYSETPHILARWGEALETFDVLYQKALQAKIEEFRAKAQKAKCAADQVLASLESTAYESLSGEWFNLPF